MKKNAEVESEYFFVQSKFGSCQFIFHKVKETNNNLELLSTSIANCILTTMPSFQQSKL